MKQDLTQRSLNRLKESIKLKEEMEEWIPFLRALPKTDLHLHLDGSIRPETMLEIALHEGIPVPTTNIDELKALLHRDTNSLGEYLTKFELPLKVFNKPEHIQRITEEVLQDATISGVRYAELRFAPLAALDHGVLPEERIEGALKGMESALRKYGIHSGLILTAMRQEDIVKTQELVDLALKFHGAGVVAVDLAGDESLFLPEYHQKAFERAHREGLMVTIHAGEVPNVKNIVESVNLLFANRIGHGIYALQDENTMAFLRRSKIPLEVCIKSNLDTKGVQSLAEHPAKKLLDKGVRVTINTDNTTLSNVTLIEEYLRFILLGAGKEDILKVVKNGIESAFAPEPLKRKLLEELSISKFQWMGRFRMEPHVPMLLR